MINYSEYTLKSFCCGLDLKTGTIIIAVAHFVFLNSMLYSWQYYTGEKVFWTIIQAIATIALFVGVNKVLNGDNNYLLYVPWIVVVFPSAVAITVVIAFLSLVAFVFVGPMVGFLYCFWCVFSAFDELRKTDATRSAYDEQIIA